MQSCQIPFRPLPSAAFYQKLAGCRAWQVIVAGSGQMMYVLRPLPKKNYCALNTLIFKVKHEVNLQ